MKTLKAIALTTLIAIASLVCGCTSTTDKCPNTNQIHQMVGAFNDESYVWENWTISTNRVEKID